MKRSKATLSVIATLLVLAVVGLLVAPGFSSEGGGAGNPAALVSNAMPGGCGMWGNPGTTNKADVADPEGGQQYCYQRGKAGDAADRDADGDGNCPMGAGMHKNMMNASHQGMMGHRHGMMSGGHHGMMGGMMGGMHAASMHGNGNWNCWNTADTRNADGQNDENFNCWNGTDTQDGDAGWNCPMGSGMHGSDQDAVFNCPMWGPSGEDNEVSQAR